MTDTEKRRADLLRQTRRIYSETWTPPAVHPRYGAVYHSLYHEEEEKPAGSFLIRLLIALMLLGVFFYADRQGMKEAEMAANEIRREFVGSVDLDLFR